jgi:hypothetical protein
MHNQKAFPRRIRSNIRNLKSAAAHFLIDRLARLSAPRWLFRLSPVARSQVAPDRCTAMRELIENNFTRSIKMLEIGTWFGEGSTRVWVESLPQHSAMVLVDAWTPYVSAADLSGGAPGYKSMNDMTFSAFHNTALRVLDYEAQRPDMDISLVRAKSSSFLKLLTGEFDLIYVDGSHYYDAIKEDLINAKRAVNKSFGIICGDDYEMGHDEELLQVAVANRDRDFIFHTKGHFHPGVLLAIAEEFGQVNMKDGFWWIICRNGEFVLQ